MVNTGWLVGFVERKWTAESNKAASITIKAVESFVHNGTQKTRSDFISVKVFGGLIPALAAIEKGNVVLVQYKMQSNKDQERNAWVLEPIATKILNVSSLNAEGKGVEEDGY